MRTSTSPYPPIFGRLHWKGPGQVFYRWAASANSNAMQHLWKIQLLGQKWKKLPEFPLTKFFFLFFSQSYQCGTFRKWNSLLIWFFFSPDHFSCANPPGMTFNSVAWFFGVILEHFVWPKLVGKEENCSPSCCHFMLRHLGFFPFWINTTTTRQ